MHACLMSFLISMYTNPSLFALIIEGCTYHSSMNDFRMGVICLSMYHVFNC